MLRAFVEWINHVSAPLYTVIYSNAYFFFDYWSIIHFVSGCLLYFILNAMGVRRIWLLLFSLLFFYELVEISMIFFALDVFKPETIKDQFTDIALGGLGAAVIRFTPSALGRLFCLLPPFKGRSWKGPFAPPPCFRRYGERHSSS